LGKPRLSRGVSSPWPTNEQCMIRIMIQAALQKSDWIGTFRIFIQFYLVEDQSHHAGMETGLFFMESTLKILIYNIRICDK